MDFEFVLQHLQPHLPPWAFHIALMLAGSLSSTINTLSYALTHPSDPDSVEALKAMVPSLLSFLAIYFTLLSVYRTIRSTVRLIFFMIKWVGILSAFAFGAAYFMRGGGAADFSDLTAQLHNLEATYKEPAVPPKQGKTGSRSMWDRFDARDRNDDTGGKLWWQKDKDSTPPAAGSAINYVIEQVASYKWVYDSLMDATEDSGAKREKRTSNSKNKPRANSKNKAGQRVR